MSDLNTPDAALSPDELKIRRAEEYQIIQLIGKTIMEKEPRARRKENVFGGIFEFNLNDFDQKKSGLNYDLTLDYQLQDGKLKFRGYNKAMGAMGFDERVNLAFFHTITETPAGALSTFTDRSVTREYYLELSAVARKLGITDIALEVARQEGRDSLIEKPLTERVTRKDQAAFEAEQPKDVMIVPADRSDKALQLIDKQAKRFFKGVSIPYDAYTLSIGGKEFVAIKSNYPSFFMDSRWGEDFKKQGVPALQSSYHETVSATGLRDLSQAFPEIAKAILPQRAALAKAFATEKTHEQFTKDLFATYTVVREEDFDKVATNIHADSRVEKLNFTKVTFKDQHFVAYDAEYKQGAIRRDDSDGIDTNARYAKNADVKHVSTGQRLDSPDLEKLLDSKLGHGWGKPSTSTSAGGSIVAGEREKGV